VPAAVRRNPALALALLLVASSVLGGCLGGPGSPGTPTDQSPTDPSATTTDAPTENATVEYVVEAGDLPDAVASAEVTLQVVFVTDTADLGPCYPEVFSGPYRPTITPLPPPAGECYRSETTTLDLAELDGERSLAFEGPASTEGHALLLTTATLRDANGSAVANVRGASDTDLATVEESPGDGPYRVEIRIDAYDDRNYDYWLFGRRSG
jgi:hypothetical protein